MNRHLSRFFRGALCAAALALAAMPCLAATVTWIPVGNAGNANDTHGYGAVSYDFSISAFEVTNAQYVEFLNAKDPSGSNALGLYSSNMTNSANGGIDFTPGNADGTKYSIKSGRDNQPVTFVSWYDTVRFANWLNNGQGNGDTETGAYTLLGGTPVPSNAASITRNPGAKIVLPNEDEWYKAAYYNGNTANYRAYPTGTNTVPNSDGPPGAPAIQANVGNFFRDDNVANGYNDGYAVTGSPTFDSNQNYLTDVGAYTGTSSFYGAYDLGGNVWEWNEALVSGVLRGMRGGSWDDPSTYLQAASRSYSTAVLESRTVGFRVAMVPEPSACFLALCTMAGFARLRRKG